MPRIIPRIETGLPARVTSFNHVTLRPLLQPQRGLIVAHHTGVDRSYAELNTESVMSVIRSINRWKPNEYNYVIDWLGQVYEFAGEHRAAHAAGFNDTGYGVLFLNGNYDVATNEQLYAFHYLFGMLLITGRVQHRPMVVGHFEISRTACPGSVKAILPRMREYSGELHSMAA